MHGEGLWEEVLDLMRKKEHLTASGLLKIVAIKFTFKKGIDSYLFPFFLIFSRFHLLPIRVVFSREKTRAGLVFI